MYLGDTLEQSITHPYASPLFGKFDGLPPMLIQCGEAEVLHDEIVLLSHKASLAGVQVQLETYEDAVSSLIFSFVALNIVFFQDSCFSSISFLECCNNCLCLLSRIRATQVALYPKPLASGFR